MDLGCHSVTGEETFMENARCSDFNMMFELFIGSINRATAKMLQLNNRAFKEL